GWLAGIPVRTGCLWSGSQLGRRRYRVAFVSLALSAGGDRTGILVAGFLSGAGPGADPRKWHRPGTQPARFADAVGGGRGRCRALVRAKPALVGASGRRGAVPAGTASGAWL